MALQLGSSSRSMRMIGPAQSRRQITPQPQRMGFPKLSGAQQPGGQGVGMTIRRPPTREQIAERNRVRREGTYGVLPTDPPRPGFGGGYSGGSATQGGPVVADLQGPQPFGGAYGGGVAPLTTMKQGYGGPDPMAPAPPGGGAGPVGGWGQPGGANPWGMLNQQQFAKAGIFTPPAPGGGGGQQGGGQQGGWLGGVAGAMGQPGPAINSQIQPQGIYNDRSTQAGINQALALGQQTAFGVPNATMQGFAGNSPTLQNRNMMNAAGALGDSSAAAEQIRLGDRAANQQNILAGQAARGIDVLGQFGNLGTFNRANQQFGTRMGGQLIDAAQNRFGGIQNSLQQGIDDRAWWNNYNLQQQQANVMQMQQQMNMLGGLGGALNWL